MSEDMESFLEENENKVHQANDDFSNKPVEEGNAKANSANELPPYEQIQEVLKYIENLRGKTEFEEEYEKQRELNVEFQCLKSISSANHGKTFAFGAEKSIKVCDSFTENELFSLSCSSKFITSISMTSDGSLLTYGSEEKFIRIYDLNSKQQIESFKAIQILLNQYALVLMEKDLQVAVVISL